MIVTVLGKAQLKKNSFKIINIDIIHSLSEEEGTVVNRALPSSHEGSLEITLTVTVLLFKDSI